MRQVYFDAQTRTQILSPTNPASPASTTDLGKALASLVNPVQSAVSAVVGGTATGAYTAYIQFQTSTVDTYKKLVKLNPKDATTQLRLAQVAQGAGDTKSAIAAYEAFLKLAPDDPSVPAAKPSSN